MCPIHVFLSERTNVTRTCLRCHSNVATLLQHHSWTGWVDVTVWASVPDFSSSSATSSSPSGPQQLLQGQWFQKGGSCLGEVVQDYVVLTRVSSFLMAVRRENTGMDVRSVAQVRCYLPTWCSDCTEKLYICWDFIERQPTILKKKTWKHGKLTGV